MWSTVECGGGGGGGGGGAAPCSRGKHSAALLGGFVYVLGGRGAGGAVPLRDFWRYCLATGEWERLECRGEPPPALQEHSATAHGSCLYVFGGEPGALSSETPLWIYSTETGLWRKLPGQPAASTLRRRASKEQRACSPRGRRGHSAHALPDCLLVYGGYKDLRGSTNELWAFHYETESWQQVRTAGAGPARHRHAAALHRNRLYVHGGQHDLRACSDLWHYDTMSRVWTQVRVPAKLSPSARSGHAGLRAGAHLYIFGGEAAGAATNELWRFHFVSETWERIVHSVKWPSCRVDACALLVPAAGRGAGAGAGQAPRPATAGAAGAGAGFMREVSRLSGLRLRRGARCSYTVLAADQDSTESLVRHEAALAKSRSAYAIDDQVTELARDPVSVPDFAHAALPTPALTPAEAARLVWLDSEEEEEMRREEAQEGTVVALPHTSSVRFSKGSARDDDAELSTSDYASAERVNRLSGISLGFSNPHYGGPDVRALAALTPDSGVAQEIEMKELRPRRAAGADAGAGVGANAGAGAGAGPGAGVGAGARLHVLLLGGREPAHPAMLHKPLSMWSYRLL